MPYLQITDFKFGLDRRRDRVAGIPGTLWTLKNAHISRGGDIQKAKKFVSKYTLPAGTVGMSQVRNQLFVFGGGSTPSGIPLGVQYQRLQNSSTTMTQLVHATSFDGNIYGIAEYDDGNIYHFYNGTRVSAWDALADAAASYTTLAEYMATKISANPAITAVASGSVITVEAKTAGTAFTISGAAVDNGVDNTQSITIATPQANVAEVAEVRASADITITGGTTDPGVNRITSVTVDGVELLSASVNFVSSNNATATALAVQINNLTNTHGYVATALGAVVTITAAAGAGTAPNGDAIVVTVGGDVTVSADATVTGGVAYVAPVAQVSTITFGGLFEALDKFTVTLNGTAYVATGRASATGTFAFTYKQRIYSTANSLLRYCKLNDPTDWTDASPATGAGFINMSNEREGTQKLVAVAEYGQYVAVFSERNIRLYLLDTDAQNNEFHQQLDNTGTIAPRGVISYGNSEVFYPDVTGIRSLRARDSVNIISVNDIGTAIDTFVRDEINLLTPGEVARGVGVVEPIDGRYWLAQDDKIFVLSYFPSSKINAWSVYEPGFSVSDLVRVADKLYVRSGNTVYLYGGQSGTTYPDADEQIASFSTPFMDAKDPANHKMPEAFDIACTGVWEVAMLVDPNDESKEIDIGTFTGTTYGDAAARNPFAGNQALLAFSLTCKSDGYASVSSIAGHYTASGAA